MVVFIFASIIIVPNLTFDSPPFKSILFHVYAIYRAGGEIKRLSVEGDDGIDPILIKFDLGPTIVDTDNSICSTVGAYPWGKAMNIILHILFYHLIYVLYVFFF